MQKFIASFETSDDFPYQLNGEAGQGSMGVVYNAFEPALERQVAIKTIRQDLLDDLPPEQADQTIQRFLQEARSAARLSHPGIATVYRVGTIESTPYMAMEWLDGETLDERLGGDPMSVEDVVRIGISLLDTLAAAHDANIVHRDIKPGNIVILDDGRIKLTDFGIARVGSSRHVETQAGVLIGTPLYAAPEQLGGEGVDGRADLYSLGVVLYEALCGRPPHDAPDVVELISLVLNKEPVAPSRYNPMIPVGLDAVLVRALRKDPGRRFPDAGAMLDALVQATGVTQPATSSGSLPTVEVDSSASALDVGDRPTPARTVDTVSVEARTPPEMIAELVRTWPERQLGERESGALLERVLERPLHADAFAGAIFIGDAMLLAHEGIILGAYDTRTGERGDGILERLPKRAPATLFRCPESLNTGRIAIHLASLLHPPRVVRGNLSSAFVDMRQLVKRLSRETFDGVLHLRHGQARGYVFFSHGENILSLFTDDWPADPRQVSWQEASNRREIAASVEALQIKLPSFSYRRELADLTFDVTPVRGGEKQGDAASKTSSAGTRWHIEPRVDFEGPRKRRGRSTVARIFNSDPVFGVQQWLLETAPRWFDERNLTQAWRYLATWLADIRVIRWHHALPQPGRDRHDEFDLVTFDQDDKVLHLAHRVEHGTQAALEQFLSRVDDAKSARIETGDVGGAVFVARNFEDEAVRHYLRLVNREIEGHGSWFHNLQDSFTKYAGFVRIAVRRGYHLLLLQEVGENRYRPLLPDAVG